MPIHVLKTDPIPFAEVWAGNKLFELRSTADRVFNVGDTLSLHETFYSSMQMRTGMPLKYTGRCVQAEITYVLHDVSYGLAEGMAILGFNSVTKFEPNHKMIMSLKETYNQWAIG